jgi:leukotriene-A4 hydrolase
VDSEAFEETVFEFFAQDAKATATLDSVDWNSCYHKPGLPPKPSFKSASYEECIELAAKWMNTESSSDFTPRAHDVEGWIAGQVITFLDKLIDASKSIPSKSSKMLGSIYGLARTKNFEFLSRYLRLSMRSKDKDILPDVEVFLGQTGRMKFVRPL